MSSLSATLKSMDMERLGNHVQAMRRLRGMTQDDLARRLGVSYQMVSRWERGRVQPTLVTALRIAQVLECSVESLFFLKTQ